MCKVNEKEPEICLRCFKKWANNPQINDIQKIKYSLLGINLQFQPHVLYRLPNIISKNQFNVLKKGLYNALKNRKMIFNDGLIYLDPQDKKLNVSTEIIEEKSMKNSKREQHACYMDLLK